MIYVGHCHCRAIAYRLRSEKITTGVRCNCSICVRKGTVMSAQYYPPEAFEQLTGLASLSVYRFGDLLVNHWFCSTCGVFPFSDVVTSPGHYRINLGCLDDLDVLALPINLLDGKSLP